MSSFGTGSANTSSASINLTPYTGTDGNQAGTDGLVPGPGMIQAGHILGAGGDWTLNVKAIADLTDASARIATTDFVQTLIGQAQLGGGNANLSALGDTQFANLVGDQFLQYDGNKWVNVSFTLATISDVDLAGLAVGNTIVWDGAEWVPGVGGGGGGAATLNGLGDVTIAGGAEFHFLVRNNAGQYVNRLISSADLSNSASIVLTSADALFGANTYNFTGATAITVPAPTADTHASTKKYVDDGISGLNLANTYQAKDASLDGITGIVDKDLLLGDGNNSFEKISVSAGAEAILRGTGSVGTLSDVDLTNVANDKILKYNNGSFVAVDETDTNTQLTDNQVKDIVGQQMLGGTETGITVSYDAVNRDIDFVVSLGGFSIRDLSDVSGDALVDGKILKVDNGVLTQVDETDTNTQRTDAEIQTVVGGMVSNNTETGITVTAPGDGTLDFEVDNTTVGFLGGVQTFTGNKTFTGNVDLTGATATVANPTQNTHPTTKSYVDTQVATKQDADASLDGITGIQDGNLLLGDGANSFEKISVTAGVETILKGSGSVGTLSDTTLQIGAVGDVLRVNVVDGNNIPTSFVNTKLASSDLSDGSNVVLNNAGKTFGAFAYDFTASTVTVKAPNGANDATTKTYVDTQVATKQDSNTNLSSISGLNIVDGSMVIGDGANSFEIITIAGGVENFLGSTGRIAALSDVTIGADGGSGVAEATGQVLRISAVANGDATYRNTQLAYTDLSGTPTIPTEGVGGYQAYDATLTSIAGAGTEAGKYIYTTGVDTWVEGTITEFGRALLDDASVVAQRTTLGLGTASLKAEGFFLADGVGLTSLSDVAINGVADAQILVADITDDGDDTNDKFKNVTLSGVISMDNAGAVSFVNDAIDENNIGTAIKDGVITNTYLESSFVNLTAGANTNKLNLGETITFSGTADEVEVSTTADVAGGVPGATITLSLPDDVTIGNDLTVTGNLIVNGTTTTIDTANMSIEDRVISLNKGVAGDNANDVGLFFDRGGLDPALFIWDESVDKFKVGTENGATDSQAGEYVLTLSKMEVGSPAANSNTTEVATTSWVRTHTSGLASSLDDLTDTTIAAVSNAQVLVYDDNNGDVFKNVTLSGDISISSETGTVAISDGVIVNNDINAGAAIAVSKLASSSVTVGTTEITLGNPSTTLSGMTGVDFAVGNASIASSIGNSTLTLGGANTTVNIAGVLTVNAPTAGSHATTKTYVDTQVATKQTSDATLTALAGVGTAANKLIYATGADAFSTTDLSVFGRTLIDDANAPTARTTLGVAIGSDVQAYNSDLAGIAGLGGVATGKIVYTKTVDGNVVWDSATFTDYGKDLLNQGGEANIKSYLNLEIGTDVQAYNLALDNLSSMGTGANKLIYSTGVDTFAESSLTAFARTILDDANAGAVRTTLGVAIGTNVQAYDASLQSISALGTVADKLIYTTAADAFAESDLTAFARTILDDANAGAVRTTLGLGDSSTLDTTITGGNGENGKAVITDGNGKLGAIDGANLTALGSIGLHSNVDLTDLAHGQGLVYSTTNGANRFEPGTVPTVGTDLNETPSISAQSISLNPNALVGGDLLIYGRVMEVIDYGTDLNDGNGDDAFNAASDFAVDFGAITDTVLYCEEDYGVLVV